jgi:hypothetical protein
VKVSDAFPSDYLKASDIGNNQVKVLISHVEMRDVGDDHKPVVFFQNKKKGVVLNVTNANAIAAAYGDDMDMWPGHAVILFTMMVSFQGRMQPGIRIRLPAANELPATARAAAPARRDPDPMPDDMSDAIPF